MEIEEIIKLCNLIQGVIGVIKSGKDLISSFTDNEPSIQSVLQQVDDDIIKGFNNLIKELNQEQYMKSWEPISATITHVYTQRKSYASILTTATQNSDGVYVVTNDQGNIVPLLDWALGAKDPVSGNRTGGTLGEMYSWLNLGEIRNQTLSSLYGIFEDPGSGSGGSGIAYGHRAIHYFMEILQSAQSFTGGALGAYGTSLQVNSLNKFQKSIFTLAASVYYTHEVLRTLIIKASNGNDHNTVSAYSLMQNNFGNSTTTGTVWHKFATAFQNILPAGATPDKQLLITSFNGSNVPSDKQSPWINCDPYNYGYTPEKFRWCPFDFQLDSYYQNAYISSIGLSSLPVMGANNGGYTFVALQGGVTQVSSGPIFTPMEEPVPSGDDLNNAKNWVSDPDNYDSYTYKGCFKMTTWNSGYVPAPVINDPTTQIPVVRGFKLALVSQPGGEGLNLAVQLKFGVMDLSDPQNPVISEPAGNTYVSPTWSGQQAIQQFLNPNYIGNVGGTSHQSRNTGIITNASFDWQAGAAPNCLNVQLFPNFYALAVFQPSNIPAVSTSQPSGKS